MSWNINPYTANVENKVSS